MGTMTDQRQRLWRRTVAAVTAELERLPARQRAWAAERLGHIAALQEELGALFVAADGPRHCRRCAGACCERGAHHFTLVNLLAFLLAGEQPPEPDFGLTCPFLGANGCRLPVARRPFNCVIFLCDEVLAGLDADQQQRAAQLEAQLRSWYEAFDKRFAGSSMRGLLIRAERLGTTPFLSPPHTARPTQAG